MDIMEQTTKFCEECGRELARAARFCTGCGAPQEMLETVFPPAVNQPTTNNIPPVAVQNSAIPPMAAENPVQTPVIPSIMTANPVQTPVAPPMMTENPVQAPVAPPMTAENPVQAPVISPVITEDPVQIPVAPPITTENPVQSPVIPPMMAENPVQTQVAPPMMAENPVETPVIPPMMTENPVQTPVIPPVITENPVEDVVDHLPPIVETATPSQKKKRGVSPAILLCLVGGILLVGGGFYALRSTQSEAPQETSTQVVPESPEIEENIPEEEDTEIQEEEVLDTAEPEAEPVSKGVDMTNVPREQLYVTYAMASSEFPQWQDITYDVYRTLDGDTGTAWVENIHGLGAGEWVEHHFSEDKVVQEIQVYNGYGSAYEQNGVINQVAVSLSDGTTFVYSLQGQWNTLVLPYAMETSWVRLRILSASSGQDQDTAISEMMIYNKSDEAPTPQANNWEVGVIGDVSALTASQKNAFVEKITAAQGSKLNDTSVLYANLVGTGNGVPLLIIQEQTYDAEYDMNFVEKAEIWQWNGSSAVAYDWNAGAENNYYALDFCGVIEKDNQYYLNFNTITGGDAPDVITYTLMSMENGMVKTLAYDKTTYAPNFMDRDIQEYFAWLKSFFTGHTILSQIKTDKLEEYLATNPDNWFTIENNLTVHTGDDVWTAGTNFKTITSHRSGGSFGCVTDFDGLWGSGYSVLCWLYSNEL